MPLHLRFRDPRKNEIFNFSHCALHIHAFSLSYLFFFLKNLFDLLFAFHLRFFFTKQKGLSCPLPREAWVECANFSEPSTLKAPDLSPPPTKSTRPSFPLPTTGARPGTPFPGVPATPGTSTQGAAGGPGGSSQTGMGSGGGTVRGWGEGGCVRACVFVRA